MDTCKYIISGHTFERRAVNVGIKITLCFCLISDTPSPPRSPTHSIHGITLFIIKIAWKPALYTGHLPAYYDVTYTPCHNQSYCPPTPIYSFCRTPHVKGQEEFHCQRKRNDMMILLPVENLVDIFWITIATVNDVGTSDAVSFIVNADFGGEAVFLRKYQSINQSIDILINQVNNSINQLITNTPFNQSINQPINQSINQSNNPVNSIN